MDLNEERLFKKKHIGNIPGFLVQPMVVKFGIWLQSSESKPKVHGMYLYITKDQWALIYTCVYYCYSGFLILCEKLISE